MCLRCRPRKCGTPKCSARWWPANGYIARSDSRAAEIAQQMLPFGHFGSTFARILRMRPTLIAVCGLWFASSAFAQSYDVVISGGRVMDPETGLDAVRNVAIADGKIARISAEKLQARRTIDAKGLVVAPGFID